MKNKFNNCSCSQLPWDLRRHVIYRAPKLPSFTSRKRQRQRRKMNMNLFLLLIQLLILVLQVTPTSRDAEEGGYSQSDLEMMTESQLEDICIKRGFQLVTDDVDPETGEVYKLTKQDFVEAAQRCLAIEKEMNDLLIQYPELADELEEEIKRMEEENAEQQAKLEELENQIDSNDKSSQPNNIAFSREAKKPNNAAFTRVEKHNDDDDDDEKNIPTPINDSIDDTSLSKNDPAPGSVPASDPTNNTGDEADKMDLSVKTSASTAASTVSNNNTSTNKNVVDCDDYDDDNNNSRSDIRPVHDDPSSTATEATNIISTSTAGAGGDSKEDFTLTHIALESLRVLMKNAKDDVKRVLELTIPVLQPLINAGDIAWKRIKELFAKSRKAYQAYQATNHSSPSSSSKGTDESIASENCEDNLSYSS